MRSGSFVCPTCGERLKLRAAAPNLFAVIGIVFSIFVPFLAGFRGLRLAALAIILLVPSLFAVSSLLSFIFRPVLVLNPLKSSSHGLNLRGR
jgi:hypothetical protein